MSNNKISVTMENAAAKRIRIGESGFYILAVPDDKQFYDFWIMHDKYESALHMFGTARAKAPDDATLFLLAEEGWKEYRNQYLDMIEYE